MKTTRLLLPFTHGVEMHAIEQAILLAQGHDATLIPLSLIYLPPEFPARGARLEHVQQSKDFLETVQHKAAHYDVPVERFEVFTGDVVKSINLVAEELKCDGVLLFVCDGNGILLQTSQIKHFMEHATCNFYVIRLPSKKDRQSTRALPRWLSNWLPGRRQHLSVPG